MINLKIIIKHNNKKVKKEKKMNCDDRFQITGKQRMITRFVIVGETRCTLTLISL